MDDDGGGGDFDSSNASSLSPHQITLIDEVRKWNDKISEMGGREEYQKASQMNTHLFSTSKWVLGILGRWGWLDGIKVSSDSSSHTTSSSVLEIDDTKKKSKKEKVPRRDVRTLEVGAINTQLLDAAARTRIRNNHQSSTNSNEPPSEKRESTSKRNNIVASNQTERVYRLDVKAIDIRSTDPRIEQMDFFDLPLPDDPNQTHESDNNDSSSEHQQPYDVIVNSMVINCVTTPCQRGKMLHLCYQQLRPGGVCFLTLPKLCLIQSKYMSRSYFEEILTKGIGFEIVKEVARESPKVAFFVLKKPNEEGESSSGSSSISSSSDGNRIWDDKFARMPVLHRGKKFRNTFAVTLNKEEIIAG